jgi:hypothetical protein
MPIYIHIYIYKKEKNSSPSLLFSPVPPGPHPRVEPPFPLPTRALAQGPRAPVAAMWGPHIIFPRETPIPPAHLALMRDSRQPSSRRSLFKTAVPAQYATPSPDPSAMAALPRLASIRTACPFHRRCGVLAKRRPGEPPLPTLYSPGAASTATRRSSHGRSSAGAPRPSCLAVVPHR